MYLRHEDYLDSATNSQKPGETAPEENEEDLSAETDEDNGVS